MDVYKEFSNISISITAAEPQCGQELSLPSEHCQSKTDGNILLQLLEFKTHLLEVVEELHIRRDAEARFEEQINTLVLEKQELEWQKESLQHQVETRKNQHAESLSKANKQAKIRNIEEEKNRYQVSAELKDKEICNLKEELKSLQLLKYNLEKKLSELEQKLLLQSRSKDSHLNQLGEMEKRFGALSRQCALVKQAHEKLEQNADEAMMINKKLASRHDKQEATIMSLNKEVEELRNKFVKVKMKSSVNYDETTHPGNPTIKEQDMKHLHQKLILENEMNRKLKDENEAIRAQKHELLRSLQLAHRLLSNQTHTVRGLELDIQTQIEKYQSLEQDHNAIQEKANSVEEKIKQLMEEYTVSKTSWDKEKAEFLNQMKNEHKALANVSEAYEGLQQRHIELSSKAKEQTQQINELKMKGKDQILCVCGPSSSILNEGNSGERFLNEHISKSESSNGVQTTNGSDSQKDTLVTVTSRGQSASTVKEVSKSEIVKSNSKVLENCLSATVFRQNTNKYNNSTIHEEDPGVASTSVSADTDQLNSPVTLSSGISENHCEINKEKYKGENAEEKVAEETHNLLLINKSENTDLQNDSEGTEDDELDTKTSDTDTSKEEREPQTMLDNNSAENVTDEKQNCHSLDSKERGRECSGLCSPSVNEKADQTKPISAVQSLPNSACHDLEGNAKMAFEESTTAGLPETLNVSSLCHSQTDAAQLDGVSVYGTMKTQTQMVRPPDTRGHIRDTVDKSATECSLGRETVKDPLCLQSREEIPEQMNSSRDSVANIMPNETNEAEQLDNLHKSKLKNKLTIMANSKNLASQDELSCSKQLKITAQNITSSQREIDLKTKSSNSGIFEYQEQPMAEETKMSIKTTHRPSFEWGTAQRREDTADIRDGHYTTTQTSQANTSGFMGHTFSTCPVFLKANQDPLAITRATDLLKASSVCGTAASSRRIQHGEWRAAGGVHRETEAQKESRVPLSDGSSLRSGAVATPLRETSQSPECDWDPNCSQDIEGQQSSFRAHISRIEQFLNTERLQLPKRRKTEN